MNAPIAESARRAIIEKAFAALDIPESNRHLIPAGINAMTCMACSGDGGPITPFLSTTKNETQEQLVKISKHAAALAKAIEALRAPAIRALASQGFVGPNRLSTPAVLRKLANAASNASRLVEGESEEYFSRGIKVGGRPSNLRAQIIEDLAAHWFTTLTNRKIGREECRTGEPHPFEVFLKDIFRASGLADRSVDYSVKRLLEVNSNSLT